MADLQTICIDDTCMNNPICCNNGYFTGTADATVTQGGAFDPRAGVNAYDENDNPIPFVAIPTEINACETGTHNVAYIANGVDPVVRTITVQQAANPTITGASTLLTVNAGEEFDPLDGVTAVDANGNPLGVTVELIQSGGGTELTVVVSNASGDMFETGNELSFDSVTLEITAPQELAGKSITFAGGSAQYDTSGYDYIARITTTSDETFDVNATEIKARFTGMAVDGSSTWRGISFGNAEYVHFDAQPEEYGIGYFGGYKEDAPGEPWPFGAVGFLVRTL